MSAMSPEATVTDSSEGMQLAHKTLEAQGASLDFHDVAGLLALIRRNGCSDEPDAESAPDFRVLFKEMPRIEHEIFWKKTLQLSGEYITCERVALNPDGGPVDETASRVVYAVALLLAAFAEGALDPACGKNLPPSFAEAAVLCQDVLLTVPSPYTQGLIAGALEKVCVGGFNGAEDYYGGVLMYVIGRCLDPKMTNSDVVRLYRVRHLLGELDWEHESIESLKMQLMRCVASPNVVRCTQGPELLALFFSVHPSFTTEVHSTIKNQVLYSRPAVLKAYSVGLFRAWKAAEGGVRVQVEHCVQDWVVLAVRSARKSAEKARALLEELHRNHHEEDANALLCRLYGPVLWRSLKVANWQVRENAARLLQYVFPLIPNELGLAEKEQELNKQVRMLRETLEDPSEPVRRIGVGSVCVILKNYWDMLPPAEIAELLTVLMNRCARDRKAPLVRAAVAEGFGWILGQALSHPTMAAVLPQTADLLNDRSPVVRAAFVNLLNTVSRCRGVSVGNVVTNEALLLRLASEHSDGLAERLQRGLQLGAKKGASDPRGDARASPELVAKHLSRLMAPSLFGQDLVQQVQRCHYLMQTYPYSLLALLTHVRDLVPAPDRVRLAAALFHYGLREASAIASAGAPESTKQQKAIPTMLKVVSVLLEGAVEATKQKKKKRGVAMTINKFPKELESFVYEHIKEDNFLGLLRATPEEGSAAAQLQEDLLFALSPLDPERLPHTVDLVRHELQLVCCGGGTVGAAHAKTRLKALMRAALRWNFLGDALGSAWERLQAASVRFGKRQPAAEDTVNVVGVAEVVFQDPEVRAAILPGSSENLKKIVEATVDAFCSAWASGLAEVRSPGGRGSDPQPKLLGPAADVWPRFAGLIVRVALHVEYRLAAPAAEQAAAKGIEDACPEGAQEAADDNQEDGASLQGRASEALEKLALTATSGSSLEVLQLVEAVAAVQQGEGPPAKRAKRVVLPSDIDCVLDLHKCLLESLNVSHFLSVLKPGAVAKDGTSKAAAGTCAEALLIRSLEDCLWRWSAAADILQPLPEGARLAQTWIFMGRMLQQMARTDIPTPDVLTAVRRLLGHTTDEVPAEDSDLKRVLQALFTRLEFEPQLVALVASLIGSSHDQNSDGLRAGAVARAIEDAADDKPAIEVAASKGAEDVHPRVVAVIRELIPSFRHLHQQLFPKDNEAAGPASPIKDRRRVFASPSPMKANDHFGLMEGMEPASSAAAEVDPADDMDGESVSSYVPSDGHYSMSVRSHSPLPQDADLFDQCFSRPSRGSFRQSRGLSMSQPPSRQHNLDGFLSPRPSMAEDAD